MSFAFITGMDSFTAGHLVPVLRGRGWEVGGTTREEDLPGRNAVACDVRDFDGLSRVVREMRPDAAVHLAGITHTAADPRETYDVNIIGSRNLLRALAEGPGLPAVVLIASSGAVYGDVEADPIHEGVWPRPRSDYAVSKLAMEHMARLWAGRLNVTVVRPFNYTGVGQSTDFVIPKIVDHFRRKAGSITLGDIDVERDFSDVRSVCHAYASLLEARPARRPLNVCSGIAHSLREVLAMMGEIAGYRIEVRSDPDLVRTGEARRRRGDPQRLAEHLGNWTPIPLRSTLEWMHSA